VDLPAIFGLPEHCSDVPVTAISYVSGASDLPLLGKTVGQAVRDAANAYGARPAICSLFQGTELNYAELDAAVDRVAAGLLALGVQSGDRVAIWSANRWEWLVAHHGAVRAGAILTPINPAFRADELRYILQDAGISVLFASPAFRSFSYVAAIEAVRDVAPDLRHVVLFGTTAPSGMLDWEQFLNLGAAVAATDLAARAGQFDFDEPCNLQYTSGTTGRPKGAILTHHNILNNGMFVGRRQRLTERDSICLPVPFFHCFGNVVGAMATLTHGAELVLPSESFDPLATLQAVQTRHCTALYGVPMMFIAMLGHADFAGFDLTSLRTGCMGAAPCPMPTLRGAVDRMNMREMTSLYGMTETSPISFQCEATDDSATKATTVGKIHPHLEAKIIDPATGTIVARGIRGELCIRGYSLMRGYWKRDDATRAGIDPAGWMHSGDLAEMREDGYVQIVGRLKDTIIRGGENIYPREVEEFLVTLPLVSEAYVFGLPDDTYGEEVCAWVRLKGDNDVTELQFKEMCRGQIASYKIPKTIRFTAEFPATASGKVQKFRMREMELDERRRQNSSTPLCKDDAP
jgi:fatty-acyl-CoA synthase